MGAVNFSIDSGMLAVLQQVLPLDIFVETGTFRGDAIERVKPYFKEIFSIELSPDYYEQAKLKYQADSSIKIIHGDSSKALTDLVPQLVNRSVVYWLDAHWCVADATAGELSQCPLLDELKAIKQLNKNSIIAIDDARLFLAPPPVPHEVSQWPSIDQVVRCLFSLSNDHSLMILNDNIFFFPKETEKRLREYGYQNGIDWLNVLDKSRDYDKLLVQLKDKDAEIFNLKQICDQREKIIIQLKNSKFFLGRLLNKIFG